MLSKAKALRNLIDKSRQILFKRFSSSTALEYIMKQEQGDYEEEMILKMNNKQRRQFINQYINLSLEELFEKIGQDLHSISNPDKFELAGIVIISEKRFFENWTE